MYIIICVGDMYIIYIHIMCECMCDLIYMEGCQSYLAPPKANNGPGFKLRSCAEDEKDGRFCGKEGAFLFVVRRSDVEHWGPMGHRYAYRWKFPYIHIHNFTVVI